MRKRWNYLREMTGLACSNPDELDRLWQAGKVPSVSLTDIDLEWEVSRIEVVSLKNRPVANECQKFVLRRLGGTDRLVTGREMLTWAREYRHEHPTLLQRFTTKIGDFFGALSEAFSSNDDGASTAGNERDRSLREPREPLESEVRHSPDNWGSLTQLRGIAGY